MGESSTGTTSGTAPVYVIVVILVDLNSWNQETDVAQIAESIVAQLSLITGIPRSSLSVQAVQTDTTQARVSVIASTEDDASLLYNTLEAENEEGANFAQKNGVTSASLESQPAPRATSRTSRALSISTLVGIIVGCVLLAVLVVVVAVIAVAMVTKYRKAAAAAANGPAASSSSSAELVDSNIMYSRNSL